MSKKNKWLAVKAKGEVGEIYIYGEIEDYKMWDEDVTPSYIKDSLDELKSVKSINLYVNSPGGSVFAGVAIYNMLKRAPQQVTAHIDGMAASIASLIILAADRVVMPINALMMIHNPWVMGQGDAQSLRELAETLDKVSDSMLIPTYQDKTGLAKDEIQAMMDKETWLNAHEALDLGFADVVEDEMKIAACYSDKGIKFKDTEIALKRFKNFSKDKFTEHKPTNTLKQRHRHTLNMLTTENKPEVI